MICLCTWSQVNTHTRARAPPAIYSIQCKLQIHTHPHTPPSIDHRPWALTLVIRVSQRILTSTPPLYAIATGPVAVHRCFYCNAVPILLHWHSLLVIAFRQSEAFKEVVANLFTNMTLGDSDEVAVLLLHATFWWAVEGQGGVYHAKTHVSFGSCTYGRVVAAVLYLGQNLTAKERTLCMKEVTVSGIPRRRLMNELKNRQLPHGAVVFRWWE